MRESRATNVLLSRLLIFATILTGRFYDEIRSGSRLGNSQHLTIFPFASPVYLAISPSENSSFLVGSRSWAVLVSLCCTYKASHAPFINTEAGRPTILSQTVFHRHLESIIKMTVTKSKAKQKVAVVGSGMAVILFAGLTRFH